MNILEKFNPFKKTDNQEKGDALEEYFKVGIFINEVKRFSSAEDAFNRIVPKGLDYLMYSMENPPQSYLKDEKRKVEAMKEFEMLKGKWLPIMQAVLDSSNGDEARKFLEKNKLTKEVSSFLVKKEKVAISDMSAK